MTDITECKENEGCKCISCSMWCIGLEIRKLKETIEKLHKNGMDN
jgi:hypothetical protein